MFLLFLFEFSVSAIFGIDYGTEYIKTSMALSGKSVHIALNQNSKRLSPSYFSFWNTTNPRNTVCQGEHWQKEELHNFTWAFLDSAKAHNKRFPNNTIQGMANLLSNQHGFTTREYLAATLRHMISSIDDGKWKPDNAQIVFAVEPFMSREERFALFETVEMMNSTLTDIIDYPTAAAHLYALEKRSLYSKKGKTVVFIDVGATNTWAAVFRFEPTKRKPTVTELSLLYVPKLGGNDIDAQISNLLIRKYMEENSIQEEITERRVLTKFMEESIKAKDTLSISKEADIRIDELPNGIPFHYVLTRDEYETLLTRFDTELTQLYTNVVQKAGLRFNEIDSIELIGGSTRVPFIQNVLLKASGLKKLDRTMNSDEAIALGAGYVGAAQSSLFIVKKVNMKPFCNINVSLIHGNKEFHIFNESSYLDEEFKYNFKAEENDNFSILINGNPMTNFFINLSNKTKPTAKIALTIGFDSYSIPNITVLKLNNFNYNLSNVIFTHPNWTLTDEQINQSFEFILEMEKIVEERNKHQETYNEYESHIYSIKDKIMYDDDFKRVTNESECSRILKVAEVHRKWLDENSDADTTTLEKKHEEFKKDLKDAERRQTDLETRDEEYEKLNKSLNWIYKELTETWPKKKKWMPKNKVKSAWKNYNSTKKWYDRMIAKQQNLSDYENPAAWNNQISMQRQIMEFNFNQSCRTKKPTPTPVGWVDPNPPSEESSSSSDVDFEEEERLHDLELEHHEAFRGHMDQFRDFMDKYRSLLNTLSNDEDIKKLKQIQNQYSDIHRDFMDAHDYFIRKIHNKMRNRRHRPKYYNDYYYYYEILKPTPSPSPAGTNETSTNTTITNETSINPTSANETIINATNINETGLNQSTNATNQTDETEFYKLNAPRRRGEMRTHYRQTRFQRSRNRRNVYHHHHYSSKDFEASNRGKNSDIPSPRYRRVSTIVVPPQPTLPPPPPNLDEIFNQTNSHSAPSGDEL